MDLRIVILTRRFLALPSIVLLLAIGCNSPLLLTSIESELTPNVLSLFATTLRAPSFWMLWTLGMCLVQVNLLSIVTPRIPSSSSSSASLAILLRSQFVNRITFDYHITIVS